MNLTVGAFSFTCIFTRMEPYELSCGVVWCGVFGFIVKFLPHMFPIVVIGGLVWLDTQFYHPCWIEGRLKHDYELLFCRKS